MLDSLIEKFGNDYTYEVIEHNSIKLLSRVKVICKKHNSTTEDLLINLLHKAVPCRDCAVEQIEEDMPERGQRKKRDLDELIAEFEERHGNRFLYHDLIYSYKAMGKKVWIKCVKHNLFFMQTPYNHLNTTTCCPECVKELLEKGKE